jgi:hypothetical protein
VARKDSEWKERGVESGTGCQRTTVQKRNRVSSTRSSRIRREGQLPRATL